MILGFYGSRYIRTALRRAAASRVTACERYPRIVANADGALCETRKEENSSTGSRSERRENKN